MAVQIYPRVGTTTAIRALAAAYLAEFRALQSLRPGDKEYEAAGQLTDPVEYLREQLVADGLEECLLDEMKDLASE